MKTDFSNLYWRIIVFFRLFALLSLPGTVFAQNIHLLGSVNQPQSLIASYSLSGNQLTQTLSKNIGISSGYHITMDSRTNVIFITTDGCEKIKYYSALNLNFVNESQQYAAANFAGLAFDNSRSKLYVITKYTNKLYIFSWNPIAKTLNLDGGAYITLQNTHQGMGLAVDEVNGHLYVADRTDYVKYYRTSDMSYVGQVQVGLFAANVAFDSRNNYLYSGAGQPAGSSFLSRFNMSNNTETRIDVGSPVLSISSDDITDNVFITTYNYGPLAGSLVAYTKDLQYITHVPNIDPYGVVVSKSISSPNPIRLEIKHQTAPDGFFEPGDTIIYQVCFDNINNPGVHATNVELLDSLPAEVTYISSTGGGVYSSSVHKITWNVGTIFGGSQQVCYEVKVKVKPATPTGSSILNYVRVTCNEIPQSFTTKSSSILLQSVSLLTPNGGQIYTPGSKINITWESENANFVNLEFSADGTTYSAIAGAQSLPAVPAAYVWTAGNNVSNNCKIRVSSATRLYHNDASDVAFTILDPLLYNVKLLSPNGGERWLSGESKSISVTASKEVKNLKVEFSTDGGETWAESAIYDSIPKNSGMTWLIPKAPSSSCLVKVSSLEIPELYDISDNSFAIVGVDLTSPDGGERYLFGSSHNITWRSNEINLIKIEYSTNNGSAWNTIEEAYPASAKYYTWSVPNTPSESAIVRIRDTQRSSLWDQSAVVFTINSLLLKSPVGGEIWQAGTTRDITWEFGNVNSVKLEYTTDNGSRWITIESNYPASSKKYEWLLPKVASTQCYVKISSVDNPEVLDISPAAFEITGSGIRLDAPVGGESWATGVKNNILWSNVNVNLVKIEFTSDGGITWETLVDSLDASFGKYDWVVPNAPSVECRIKITDVENPSIIDSSATYFRIGGFPYAPPGAWRFTTQTGNNSVVLLPRVIDPQIGDRSFQPGDAVGVFCLDNGKMLCAGYSKWEDGQNLAITVWGDNARTIVKDGFAVNEKYIFKIWDAIEGVEILAEATFESLFSTDPDKYNHDKISIIKTFKSHSELTIPLPGNLWSLISSNLIPYPSDIASVMSGVESSLDFMKNDLGEIYHPVEGVNSILNWRTKDGYQVNMKEDDTLTIKGTRVDLSANKLSFTAQKWYIIAYLPQESMPITTALATISNVVLMVKNTAGKIYFPQYNINNILTMYPGEGYKLSVSAAGTLTYPQSASSVQIVQTPIGKFPDMVQTGRYESKFSETGNSAVIIVESTEIPEGSEIGALTSDGLPIGSAFMQNGSAVITLWGDNPATGGIIEGATDNEPIQLRYYSAADGKEYVPEIKSVANMLTGKTDSRNFKYRQDAVWLAQSAKGSPATSVHVTEDVNSVCFEPNPAKDFSVAKILLANESSVRLTVYDMLGNVAAKVADGRLAAGLNKIYFDTSNLPTGVYFYSLTAGDYIKRGSLTVVR